MKRDDSYHKEDLRGDLVKAGLAHVHQHGHASLSVRTLAQAVGVSPGAPYHHFPDRRSLLLAIAIAGFEELIRQGSAMAGAHLSGTERLKALGMSFIEFSDAHPKLMELMYESELAAPQHDRELEKLQRAGQNLVREAIRAELPRLSPRNIELRAVGYWSLIYGFAALRRKANLPSLQAFKMDAREVARSVTHQAALNAVGTG